MTLSRVLKWAGCALLISIVALVTYLSFADLAWIAPRAEEAIREATGRDLEIAGALSIDALPHPTLTAENVTFSNAQWGSEPLMAEVGHVTAKVRLLSLLSGPIKVEELRLHDAQVLLEKNSEGEANWQMGSGETETKSTDAGTGRGLVPVAIKYGKIRNVTLTLRVPDRDDRVVTLDSLDIQSAVGQMEIDGKGTFNEHLLELSGKVGGRLSTDDPLLVDLAGSLGNLNFDIEGQVTDSATLEGTELGIDISSEDVGPLIEEIGLPLTIVGPLRIQGEIAQLEAKRQLTADFQAGDIEARIEASGSDRKIDFEVSLNELDKLGAALGIDALPASGLALAGGATFDDDSIELRDVTATIGDTVAVLRGAVATSPEGSTEVEVNVEGADLSQLSPELPALAFKLAAVLTQQPHKLLLHGLDLTFGESDLRGSLTVETGEATVISGRIDSRKLDFSPFMDPGEESAVSGEEPTSPEIAEAEGENHWVFTEDPLPYETLNQTQLDLAYEIAELTSPALHLLDVAGSIKLDEGQLDLETTLTAPAGGKIAADISLNSGVEPATLDLDVTAEGFGLQTGDTALEHAPSLGMSIDVNSMGNSMRDLASSTFGDVLVTVGPGRMGESSNALLSSDFIGEVLSALNPFEKEEEYTVMDCVVFALGIEDGLAEIEAMFVQTEKLMVVGKGRIDLNTEKLKLEFNTKPREGVGISIAGFVTPFVKVSGTLAEPGIGLDKSGVLFSGGAAVATGGLSFLYKGVADRATAGGDRCQKVLATVTKNLVVTPGDEPAAQTPAE